MRINITKVPEKPGVYLFKGKEGKVLYIGKALNLRKRLKGYLNPTDTKIMSLVEKIINFETLAVASEIEALILEANLIKKFQPEYNVRLKDDKDYLYIKITNDPFPKVISARKKTLSDSKVYFGPYPSAAAVRTTLKIVRRIFPFSSCKPGRLRACLYYHLGLCPGVCIGEISQKDYSRNIRNVIRFLEGKKHKILDDLRKEMVKASVELKFEEADEIYNKIKSIEYITQPISDVSRYVEEPDFLKTYRQEALTQLMKVLSLPKMPKRIEGYDISNIQGEFATGSMVVFKNGEPEKESYRKFKIKKYTGISDTNMLKEVLQRRFLNSWPKPDLIFVDGGKGQLSAALSVLREFHLSIPVAALAKRLEEIFLPAKEKSIRLPRNSSALHIAQRVRDEAHRFAISYHRKIRNSNFLTIANTFVKLK